MKKQLYRLMSRDGEPIAGVRASCHHQHIWCKTALMGVSERTERRLLRDHNAASLHSDLYLEINGHMVHVSGINHCSECGLKANADGHLYR